MARKRQGAGDVEQRLIRIVERRSPGFGASIKQTQLTLEVIEITMHRQGGRGQHPGLLLASVARENLGDRQRGTVQAQIMLPTFYPTHELVGLVFVFFTFWQIGVTALTIRLAPLEQART